jgi:hypothetical protein
LDAKSVRVPEVEAEVVPGVSLVREHPRSAEFLEMLGASGGDEPGSVAFLSTAGEAV